MAQSQGHMERVAIVGVGLIGGSMGLALKKHGFGGAIKDWKISNVARS